MQDEHIERLIDEALEETFPASDPPSPAIELPLGNGGEKRRKEKDISKRW